ncbi:unnamed protein product [Acanthoscelides obtectus]|uniref:Uncharacterized protein n=1 Tax=Acanthoscelides obtectus TaxID=200917 RepID=A0A9P0KP25_ACAOB|nr:unnamed protein product [Acanthoscelides obtectus]CAK1640178.1 hypothetical protein AOBTE_LOCUS11579 [Acanthoscelides obtectus]
MLIHHQIPHYHLFLLLQSIPTTPESWLDVAKQFEKTSALPWSFRWKACGYSSTMQHCKRIFQLQIYVQRCSFRLSGC